MNQFAIEILISAKTLAELYNSIRSPWSLRCSYRVRAHNFHNPTIIRGVLLKILSEKSLALEV